MPNEFLSQEEVDQLLDGVAPEAEATAANDPAGGVRPYQLGSHERIVRGRMPTLEVINDRFVRLLRIGMFNFMRRSPEITATPVKVIKYGDFVRGLVVPTNLNVLSARPLRGNALFVFEPALVFLIIDNLFGGDGRFHVGVEGREFTQTEQRIIDRLLHVVLEDYHKSWAPVHPLRFEYVRSEMHPQFANIANPGDIVVASTFNVAIGGHGGAFHICVPYATLEPIRDIIYSTMQGDQSEPDRRWHQLLQRQVQNAEVEIVANLATTKLTLAELMRMKVGDVLPIDLPSLIEAKVDGVPVMQCGYGEIGGHHALRVERLLRPEKDPRKEPLHG
jgi:flagellar motor switch protein FliM